VRADAAGERRRDAAMLKVELCVANLRLAVVHVGLGRLPIGRPLIDVLHRAEIAPLQLLGAKELAVGQLQPCRRALQLSRRLSEPVLVGTRIDDEEEIAFVVDVAVLEVNFRERAADLGAQLDLVDRGELAEEA
jgi:hypothetical protein